jgi:hypothetical protein
MKATASEKKNNFSFHLFGWLSVFLQQNHFLKLNQTQAKSSNEAKKTKISLPDNPRPSSR